MQIISQWVGLARLMQVELGHEIMAFIVKSQECLQRSPQLCFSPSLSLSWGLGATSQLTLITGGDFSKQILRRFDSCQISELRKIVVTQIISLLMPEKSLLASLSHSSQILLFERAVRNAQHVHRPLHVWWLLGQSHRRTKVYLFSCSLFNIAPREVRLIG